MHPLSQPSAEQISSGAPGVMLRRAFNHAQTHVYTRSRFVGTRPADDKLHTPCLMRTSSPPMRRQIPLAMARGVRRILADGAASGRLIHVERLPERPGKRVPWPGWVPADVMKAFALAGVPGPWVHQAQAADLAHSGHNVIMATGTASGKSVGYLVPALAAIETARPRSTSRRPGRSPRISSRWSSRLASSCGRHCGPRSSTRTRQRRCGCGPVSTPHTC